MKSIIIQLIRLPLDLIFVSIDWLRSLPEYAGRIIRKHKMCTFCELARVDSSAVDRPCYAAKKYANLWIFRGVCPCARPADATHKSPYCQAKNPYFRRLWHLPMVGLLLAMVWLGIGLGIAELAGVPATAHLVKRLQGGETNVAVAVAPVSTPAPASPTPIGSPSDDSAPATAPDTTARSDGPIRRAPQIDLEQYEKAMVRADTAFAEGAHDQARIAYLNARKYNPTSAAANHGIGRCYLLRGQLANALDALETAASLDPDLPGLHLDLAEVHAHRAAHSRALEHALAHRVLHPDDPRGHLYLLRIYDDLEDYTHADEAAAWLQQFPDLSLDHQAELGAYYLRRDEVATAQAIFRQLAESPTHPVQGLQGLARIEIKQGALDQASVTLLQASKLETNSLHTAILQADVALLRGETKRGLEDYKTLFDQHPDEPALALAYVEQLIRAGEVDQAIAIAERTTHSSSPLLERNAKIALAEIYLGKGLYRQAQRYADEVLQGDPQQIHARYLRAQCLIGQKQMADAEQELRGVLDTRPDHAHARVQLSQVLLSSADRDDEAIDELEQLAKFMPDNPAPFGRMAQLYFSRGDFAKTIEAATRAREREADAPMAVNRLILALIETGDIARANEEINPTYAGNPTNGYIADAYGWTKVQTGEIDLAIRALEYANTRLRGPLVSHHLGAAYAKKGEVKLARKHLSRALEFNVPFPGKDQVEALLKTLAPGAAAHSANE